MTIFHASIIMNKKFTIAEHYTHPHNLISLLKHLFKKMKDNSSKTFEFYERFSINLISEENIIYCNITTKDYPLEKSYSFLNTLQKYYKENYENIDTNETNKFIEKQINYYNENFAITNMEKLSEELNLAKNLFVDAKTKLIEREAKLDDIKAKTDKLATNFDPKFTLKKQLIKKNTKEEKNKIFQKRNQARNCKIIIFSIVILFLVIILLLLYICGGYKLENC